MSNTYDVIVAGSGSAGMTAAVRVASKGLKILVVEKAHKIGGTSATSGGVTWIPNHGLGTDDSLANRPSLTSTLSPMVPCAPTASMPFSKLARR